MATSQDVTNRVPITIGLMLATVMNSLDTTIANVALPHIQGSVGASPDQIAWVLTSYLIATAIMTPLSGWLSRVMSTLCGSLTMRGSRELAEYASMTKSPSLIIVPATSVSFMQVRPRPTMGGKQRANSSIALGSRPGSALPPEAGTSCSSTARS